MQRTVTALLFLTSLLINPLWVSADEHVHFEPDPGFIQLPETIKLGSCSAVDVDSKGQIYLFHRGKEPIICLDENGKYVRSWGDGLVGSAHGLRIDRDGSIWITDTKKHLVRKFDPEGRLLLTLGQENKAGTGTDQFDKPTDLAFGADGAIYVSDGYGNSRMMKFSTDGKFIKTWGSPGKGPGQFDTPHAVVVNAEGWVIVGDRENDRVQIFDSEGQLITIWTGFAPFGLDFDASGTLFAADGRAHQVLQIGEGGNVVARTGKEGKTPGEFDLPHMLAADAQGNLYVTEILGERMQRLTRVEKKPTS